MKPRASDRLRRILRRVLIHRQANPALGTSASRFQRGFNYEGVIGFIPYVGSLLGVVGVHLNPVWVIFALYVFGYLFGLVGLMVAVPAAAAIGVLVRFALREYYASSLYATTSRPAEIPSKGREPDA